MSFDAAAIVRHLPPLMHHSPAGLRHEKYHTVPGITSALRLSRPAGPSTTHHVTESRARSWHGRGFITALASTRR